MIMGRGTLLAFASFDYHEFKRLFTEQAGEQRDRTNVIESQIAKENAMDMANAGWISREEAEAMPVLQESDAPITRSAIPLESDSKLQAKALFLQDELIYRAILQSKEDGNVPVAYINASIIKEAIGRHYKPILEVFQKQGCITKDFAYGDGYSYGYRINLLEINEIPIPGELKPTIDKYRQKVKNLVTTYKENSIKDNLKTAMMRTSDNVSEQDISKFLLNYTKSLNHIEIRDKEGLNAFILAKNRESVENKVYYDYIYRSLTERKDIYRVDAQGRFYHILTSAKREIKDYLNIGVAVDCKNSHPLLFNYILFIFNNIDISFSLRISSTLHQLFNSFIISNNNQSIYYHYVGKSIRKELIDSGINKTEIAGLTDDMLQYIFETSNGVFWDNICAEHPEYERTDIKQKMFAEVFYSNTAQLSHKEFGKLFAARYPNVYREIKRWKSPSKYPDIDEYLRKNGITPKKSTASLSVALMALEANIFRSALESLYRKRYDAIHIHDCIVIPDTGKTHQATEQVVTKILLEEYQKYGLIPTLKAE